VKALGVLARLRQKGCRFVVRGDRLHISAPLGVVTPEVRELLTRLKPEILALLAPLAAATELPDLDSIEDKELRCFGLNWSRMLEGAGHPREHAEAKALTEVGRMMAANRDSR